MKCPQCAAEVADGEAICPKCDHIIDASFLAGADVAPPEESDRTAPARPLPKLDPNAPPRAAKPGTGQRPAVKPATGQRAAVKPGTGQRPAVKPATGTQAPVKSGPNPVGRVSGSQKAVRAPALTERPAGMPEPETDAATNIVPPKQAGGRAPPTAPAPAAPAGRTSLPPATSETSGGISAPRTFSGIHMVAPDQALDDFKLFLGTLPAGDKIAFVAASLTVLTTFLPWKETAAEGEILGLMSLGFVVFLVMIAVIAAIVIRVRRVMPQLNPLVPWLVQLGGTGFAALWCIIYVGLSIDSRKTQALVGNFEVSVSAPAFGVWLAFLGCGATLAGTLMGLKQRPA